MEGYIKRFKTEYRLNESKSVVDSLCSYLASCADICQHGLGLALTTATYHAANTVCLLNVQLVTDYYRREPGTAKC